MNLLKCTRGAELVGYMVVTGAVAIACVVAVSRFNHSNESAIQSHSERASRLIAANEEMDTSLAAETAREVSIDTGTGIISGAAVAPAITVMGAVGRKRSKSEDKAADLPGQKSIDSCKPGQACSSPSGNCFVAGTLVLTPTGLRPIEDIKVGDLVMVPARDEAKDH